MLAQSFSEQLEHVIDHAQLAGSLAGEHLQALDGILRRRYRLQDAAKDSIPVGI